MKVDVSMTTDENRFHVNSWWATSPDFALAALNAQLEAASSIWPELHDYLIVRREKASETPSPPEENPSEENPSPQQEKR